jgi:hypothetical protein
MRKPATGTPRSLYLCPDFSTPCIDLLVGHYRSRIALIDQLVDELA